MNLLSASLWCFPDFQVSHTSTSGCFTSYLIHPTHSRFLRENSAKHWQTGCSAHHRYTTRGRTAFTSHTSSTFSPSLTATATHQVLRYSYSTASVSAAEAESDANTGINNSFLKNQKVSNWNCFIYPFHPIHQKENNTKIIKWNERGGCEVVRGAAEGKYIIF